MDAIVNFLADLVAEWGYFGIIALMALESSFFPFPSEVVMIPAGFLVAKGQMSAVLAVCSGILGSLLGAIFNYYLCYFLGREMVAKYGKFVGITQNKFKKFEDFFERYGEISTFSCRLLPGIRQYISLPAGLAKMNFTKFCIFTALGAGIWVGILVILGALFYTHQELIDKYLHYIIMILAIFVFIILSLYFYKKFKDKQCK